MNTPQLLIIVVAVVVIGGGAWLLLQPEEEMSPSTDATDTSAVSDTDEMESVESSSFTGSDTLAALMQLGASVRCDFVSTDEDGTDSEGTFYTDQSRFRVDAETSTDGETYVSHMINDDERVYVWGETPEGMMGITFSGEDMEPTEPESYELPAGSDEEYVDMSQRVAYDCGRWNVDASVFTPPSDVEFSDMNAMMEEMMQNMPEGMQMPEGFGPPRQ